MSVRVDLASLETGNSDACVIQAFAHRLLFSFCACPLSALSHGHTSLKIPWTGRLGVSGGGGDKGAEVKTPDAGGY